MKKISIRDLIVFVYSLVWAITCLSILLIFGRNATAVLVGYIFIIVFGIFVMISKISKKLNKFLNQELILKK
jgi:hypothetical protein